MHTPLCVCVDMLKMATVEQKPFVLTSVADCFVEGPPLFHFTIDCIPPCFSFLIAQVVPRLGHSMIYRCCLTATASLAPQTWGAIGQGRAVSEHYGDADCTALGEAGGHYLIESGTEKFLSTK